MRTIRAFTVLFLLGLMLPAATAAPIWGQVAFLGDGQGDPLVYTNTNETQAWLTIEYENGTVMMDNVSMVNIQSNVSASQVFVPQDGWNFTPEPGYYAGHNIVNDPDATIPSFPWNETYTFTATGYDGVDNRTGTFDVVFNNYMEYGLDWAQGPFNNSLLEYGDRRTIEVPYTWGYDAVPHNNMRINYSFYNDDGSYAFSHYVGSGFDPSTGSGTVEYPFNTDQMAEMRSSFQNNDNVTVRYSIELRSCPIIGSCTVNREVELGHTVHEWEGLESDYNIITDALTDFFTAPIDTVTALLGSIVDAVLSIPGQILDIVVEVFLFAFANMINGLTLAWSHITGFLGSGFMVWMNHALHVTATDDVGNTFTVYESPDLPYSPGQDTIDMAELVTGGYSINTNYTAFNWRADGHGPGPNYVVEQGEPRLTFGPRIGFTDRNITMEQVVDGYVAEGFPGGGAAGGYIAQDMFYGHTDDIPCLYLRGPAGETDRLACDDGLAGAVGSGGNVQYDLNMEWGHEAVDEYAAADEQGMVLTGARTFNTEQIQVRSFYTDGTLKDGTTMTVEGLGGDIQRIPSVEVIGESAYVTVVNVGQPVVAVVDLTADPYTIDRTYNIPAGVMGGTSRGETLYTFHDPNAFGGTGRIVASDEHGRYDIVNYTGVEASNISTYHVGMGNDLYAYGSDNSVAMDGWRIKDGGAPGEPYTIYDYTIEWNVPEGMPFIFVFLLSVAATVIGLFMVFLPDPITDAIVFFYNTVGSIVGFTVWAVGTVLSTVGQYFSIVQEYWQEIVMIAVGIKAWGYYEYYERVGDEVRTARYIYDDVSSTVFTSIDLFYKMYDTMMATVRTAQLVIRDLIRAIPGV